MPRRLSQHLLEDLGRVCLRVLGTEAPALGSCAYMDGLCLAICSLCGWVYSQSPPCLLLLACFSHHVAYDTVLSGVPDSLGAARTWSCWGQTPVWD